MQVYFTNNNFGTLQLQTYITVQSCSISNEYSMYEMVRWDSPAHSSYHPPYSKQTRAAKTAASPARADETATNM